jgi:hypothetical protein
LWRIVIENNDNRSWAWIKNIIIKKKEKEMMWCDVNVDVWEAARLLSQQRISTQVQSLGIYAKP